MAIEHDRRQLVDRVAPITAGALFLWGALLGLAPLVATVAAWHAWHDVFGAATAGGLAGVGVVAVFAATVGRAL